MKIKTTTILLHLILVSFLIAQTASPNTPKFEKFLQQKMKERDIPGMQAVVLQRGKVIYSGAFGQANLEHSVPVTKQTVFSINSITKAFTGVAVMQLVEQGKLDLNTPVSRYLDGLPAEWQPVTLKQILSHQSGIPDVLNMETEKWIADDLDDAFAKAKKLPMQFKPGEQFSYNQTNYVLIGKILDKIGGKSFVEQIVEKQFNSAGMTRTGFGDFYDVVPGKAQSYAGAKFYNGSWKQVKMPANVYETFPDPVRTAAGINSTAEDMARWVTALTGGKLLKKESLKTLWTPTLTSSGRPAGFSDLLNGYAIGWPVMIRGDKQMPGGVGGGRAAVFIFPDRELAIIVLSNRLGASPEVWIEEAAGFF